MALQQVSRGDIQHRDQAERQCMKPPEQIFTTQHHISREDTAHTLQCVKSVVRSSIGDFESHRVCGRESSYGFTTPG